MKNKTSVLIVGADLSGLVLALWLRKNEIPLRIVDKAHAPCETLGDHAIQARTLEFYEQLGIADEIISAGTIISDLIFKYNNQSGKQICLGDYGKLISPHPYLLFLSQVVHEKILIKALENLNIVVERRIEFLNFVQNKHQIEAYIKTPAGEEKIITSYLCGCDGPNSVIRNQLGIKFFSENYQQSFFIAEVIPDLVLSPISTKEEIKTGLQISMGRHDFCIAIPTQKLNSVCLTGVVPPESEDKDNLSYINISNSDSIKNCGLEIQKINQFSTHNVHHRIATHFQQGRVFLVGGAAHTHSFAGGQSVNAGIGDAVNLAWKLVTVLNGQARSKILSTYEIERTSAAETLLFTTDNIFRTMASRSFFGLIFRSYMAPLFFSVLVKFKPFLRFAFKLLSQTLIHYRESPISEGISKIIHPGDRLPWLKTSTFDNYDCLKLMDWHIQIYGKTDEDFARVANFRGLRIYEFAWSEQVESKGFLQDAFYLMRPDGHIALASIKQNSQILKSYLNNWGIERAQTLSTMTTAI